MNNNFTPEEKLRIIDLLAVTQSKEEFLDAVNKLLSEESKKETLLSYKPCCWRYSSVAGSFNWLMKFIGS